MYLFYRLELNKKYWIKIFSDFMGTMYLQFVNLSEEMAGDFSSMSLSYGEIQLPNWMRPLKDATNLIALHLLVSHS